MPDIRPNHAQLEGEDGADKTKIEKRTRRTPKQWDEARPRDAFQNPISLSLLPFFFLHHRSALALALLFLFPPPLHPFRTITQSIKPQLIMREPAIPFFFSFCRWGYPERLGVNQGGDLFLAW